jgi:hypothetical protein
MALTTVGAGIDLLNTLLTTFAPGITQEQKESLLDEYKKRLSAIQDAGDALRANPADRAAQLAMGALTDRVLNAAGLTAPGLASIDIAVPLDDYLQLLTGCDLAAFLLEQQQAGGK